MAIINKSRFSKKEKIKGAVSADVAATIKEYCAWAHIEDIGFFIEEAACYVFLKDKDWKDHQLSIKRAGKKEVAAS